MKKIFLIFPTQLFSNINNLKDKEVYLIEEPRYFTDYKYHKLKLAYHRSTMKTYEKYLKNKNLHVKYIDFKEINNSFYNKIKTQYIEFYELFDNKIK